MQELIGKIKKMYQKLDGPLRSTKVSNDNESDAGSGTAKNENVLPYLIYIETKLNNLMEARDYWTKGLKYNDLMKGNYDHRLISKKKVDQALGVFDLERQIEKDVKHDYRIKKIQEEQEEL